MKLEKGDAVFILVDGVQVYGAYYASTETDKSIFMTTNGAVIIDSDKLNEMVTLKV